MIIWLLVLAAFAAGLVDSIAGGGGIISLPALLAGGLGPASALATNKGQSVFGSGMALAEFARKGAVDKSRALWSFIFAAAGSLIGARVVLLLDPRTLRPLVLGLLLCATGVAWLRKPAHGRAAWWVARWPRAAAAAFAILIGGYDGFFGPGTGTFLVLVYAHLWGDSLVGASANAKVANFASNLAAFACFAWAGAIVWKLAIPMAIAQAAGALVGTRLTLRRGEALVRVAAMVVSLLLAARVVWQMTAQH